MRMLGYGVYSATRGWWWLVVLQCFYVVPFINSFTPMGFFCKRYMVGFKDRATSQCFFSFLALQNVFSFLALFACFLLSLPFCFVNEHFVALFICLVLCVCLVATSFLE